MEAVTKEQLAAMLNGREYREEITRSEEVIAKQNGLVVVFGASDDLVELRGAMDDEAGMYNGGLLILNQDGIVEDCGEPCDHCSVDADQEAGKSIECVWGEDDHSWTYKTEIPHATFEIIETYDGEVSKYCRGIVFNLSDL